MSSLWTHLQYMQADFCAMYIGSGLSPGRYLFKMFYAVFIRNEVRVTALNDCAILRSFFPGFGMKIMFIVRHELATYPSATLILSITRIQENKIFRLD